MKLSISCPAVFGGLGLEKGLPIMKSAGFRYAEFWSLTQKEAKTIGLLLPQYGMEAIAMCPSGSSLVDETQREGFLTALDEAITTAKGLGMDRLILTVGQALEDVSREKQKQSIIDGLIAAVPRLEQSGITLMVEPLNIVLDHKGYFLYRSDEAVEILRSVNHPHVKMLFDIYHQQMDEGNLTANIKNYLPYIAHFHVAGVPGRGCPLTSEINYDFILKKIEDAGFTGYIGLEYFPNGSEKKMSDDLHLLGEHYARYL